MSEYIKFFEELSKTSVKIAGGKGASLGEMSRLFSRRTPPEAEPFGDFKNRKLGGQARAYNPIPQGFVVTAAAFDRFLHETNLKEEIDAAMCELNYQDVNQVDEASNVIRDLIHDARMPKDLQVEILEAYKKLAAPRNPVTAAGATRDQVTSAANFFIAVRSSATAEDSSQASWAGELESYLNSTDKNLLGNVKKCWSSLFTPRAIVYRNEKGMRRSHVSVAVVVQKMVQSEIAGVCFTVHPVTRDKHQMILEAVWGLGECLVGGEVTPDSYVLDKRDWTILDVNVSEQEIMKARKGAVGVKKILVPAKIKHKQKLDGRQIVELAKLCASIEKHYKFPCDIEWAYEGKKFYIVQSRPITTL